ncbi:unnamed protein product [Dovyalis caffra]|uniref:Uncharacterized protein n=1 Tax=Dovyalis caffra TaxID=77055 RepID=A0AAV1QR88_9ROSI|nr:unnamed protein product [Dovyalis caffra]
MAPTKIRVTYNALNLLYHHNVAWEYTALDEDSNIPTTVRKKVVRQQGDGVTVPKPKLTILAS